MPFDPSKPSRREFARRAALLSVAAPLAGAAPLSVAASLEIADGQQLPKLPPNFPRLSDQSLAEAEERYDTIIKQYGSRFSSEQKADLRRLCFVAQPPLDNLRAFAIQNGDSPALYLKPTVDRDRKQTVQTPKTPAPAAKKP